VTDVIHYPMRAAARFSSVCGLSIDVVNHCAISSWGMRVHPIKRIHHLLVLPVKSAAKLTTKEIDGEDIGDVDSLCLFCRLPVNRSSGMASPEKK